MTTKTCDSIKYLPDIVFSQNALYAAGALLRAKLSYWLDKCNTKMASMKTKEVSQ